MDLPFALRLGLPASFLVFLLPSNLFASTVAQKYQLEFQTEIQQCTRTIDKKVAEGRTKISGCSECDEKTKDAKRQQLNILAEREKVKCELKAVTNTLDKIRQQKRVYIEKLKTIQSRFNKQVENFESWKASIVSDYDAALEQLSEVVLGAVVQGVMDKGAKVLLENPLEELSIKAAKYKDIRMAKQKQMRDFINSFRSELEGKSKEQAKSIVRRRIIGARDAVNDLHAINKFAIDTQITLTISQDDAKQSEIDDLLDAAYSGVVTGADIMSSQSKGIMKQLFGLSGVIGLAPTIVDTGITLWVASVNDDNLKALDELRRANAEELQLVRGEISELVSLGKTLRAKKSDLELQAI